MPKLLRTSIPETSPPPEQKPAEKFRRLFELCGVSFPPGDSVEARAEECPFCHGSKFHVNFEKEGVYKCFSENKCGASGNAFTLIRWWYSGYLSATTDEDYQRLKAKRDL